MDKKYSISLGETFFLQLVVWTGIWLLNDYLATLLTFTIGAVVLAVLIVALLAEAFERSKVPRAYFYVMLLSLLAMAMAALTYVMVLGGRLDFLE